MSIIRSHNTTLYGGNDEYKIILRPLSDEHLPYLYKWNADPEVLYWTEGGEDVVRSYSPEIVHQIYGGISKDNLCFAVEVNGEIIGECWLQKMNLPDVKRMYPDGTDVRRIDMAIGEKAYWGKGIGTLFIGMLVDYAFSVEKVDVLHCFCEDYNIRSRRVWEKNGFSLILTEELPQGQKGKLQYHWRLTRGEFEGGKMEDLITKTLKSDRLILRRFKVEDAAGMYSNWASDPECCKFLAWDIHKDVEETKAIIQSWINGYDNGSLNWIVELKDTHEVIGSISAVVVSKKHLTAELGYCYGSKFWGHGYATEALRTVIEYLLRDCGFYLIEARHISGNPASGRVMEKAGMHKDAVLRARRINKFTNERDDSVIYSITKNELS